MEGRRPYGSRYSRMDQVKFVEDSLQKIWDDMVCLSRPYHLRFFKGCFPQILLDPFVNTLTHIFSVQIGFLLKKSISLPSILFKLKIMSILQYLTLRVTSRMVKIRKYIHRAWNSVSWYVEIIPDAVSKLFCLCNFYICNFFRIFFQFSSSVM